MKNRIFAIAALCVLVLNLGGSTFADTKSKSAKKANRAQLVALLPASDAVVAIDAKRFFGEALPKILSANQPMLGKVVAHLDDLKAKTGIDLRQFETIAAGVIAKRIKAKEYDFDPVVLARGQINANALIGAAKLAANGKYREERVGSRTVYIFEDKTTTAKTQPQTPNDKADKTAGKFPREIAATVYDANTIAFGSLARVRVAVESRTKVSPEITALLARKEVSVTNFAARVPEGMSAFLPMENDELGKNINSIRFVFGSVDVAGDNATVHMTAQTVETSQAQGLLETLEGLQLIGKAFLGGSKSADKQVYARMIDNARFSVKGNEVTLDLQIPQGDIDILIGSLK